MTWSINSTTVTSPSGRLVSLPYPVAHSAEANGILVVVLDVPRDQTMTENVFGISRDGKILWQIERTSLTASDPVNTYTDIRNSELSGVHLFNWNGMDVVIDAATGQVISASIVK